MRARERWSSTHGRPAMDERERRLAQNEALFREVNERVNDLATDHGAASVHEYLCECANADCTFRVRLDRATTKLFVAIRSSSWCCRSTSHPRSRRWWPSTSGTGSCARPVRRASTSSTSTHAPGSTSSTIGAGTGVPGTRSNVRSGRRRRRRRDRPVDVRVPHSLRRSTPARGCSPSARGCRARWASGRV